MTETFAGYHPVVNFTWFTLVLVFSMVFMHPVMLGVSLVCSMATAAVLTGGKAARKSLRVLLPLILLTAV